MLAQRLAALTHHAYQRCSLQQLFRGRKAPGKLILKGASRLDAFSGYPVRI